MKNHYIQCIFSAAMLLSTSICLNETTAQPINRDSSQPAAASQSDTTAGNTAQMYEGLMNLQRLQEADKAAAATATSTPKTGATSKSIEAPLKAPTAAQPQTPIDVAKLAKSAQPNSQVNVVEVAVAPTASQGTAVPSDTTPKSKEQIQQILDLLALSQKGHDEAIQICYSQLNKLDNSTRNAKRLEDATTITGFAFVTGGIISTYHPVAAGLTAIGTLLSAGSKSVGSVIDGNVSSSRDLYNQFQTSITNAESAYWKDFEDSWAITSDPGNVMGILKRAAAVSKLQAACHRIGIQITATTTAASSEANK